MPSSTERRSRLCTRSTSRRRRLSEPFDAAEGESETGDRTLDLEPGQVVMLESGEEIQTSAPADSGGTYQPFQYPTPLQVSAALGIP
jgi:capsid protein